MDKLEQGNPKRTLILINVVLMTFMATLDGSIVNVALPGMAKSLATSTGTIAWVVTSYMMTIVALILVFGKLGDTLGLGRVFLGGIALFTVGSLLCGVSGSFALLTFARILQGVGAAAAMANNQGIITRAFPASERGKALGITGSFVALGTLAGPPLGGFIVDALSWQYIFLINVPIGIVVFAMGLKLLPREKNPDPKPLDVPGAILFALPSLALFFALIEGGRLGYGNPAILALLAAAVLFYVLFFRRMSSGEAPLLDLGLFKNRLFSLSLFCAFLSFIALTASNIVLPFYLQNALGLSPSSAGVILMVYPLVLAVSAPISGRLSDRIGSELLTFAGLTLSSLALVALAFVTRSESVPALLVCIALMALGNGMFQSPNNSLIMSSVPRASLGTAGSINALVRNFGMVLGVSASVSLLYGLMSLRLGSPVFTFVEGRKDVFYFGLEGVYLAAAAAGLLGAVLTGLRMRAMRRS